MKTNSTWGPLNSRPSVSLLKQISIFSVIPAVAVFLVSCAGGGNGNGTPEWLTSYPAEKGFYVGIGGSNTGNMAEDREAAAAKARADLAAQISTEISSEMDVYSAVSTDSEFSESISQSIGESVEQNLQAVETVDTWMSPDQGAWVYVRLSQAKWAAIINKEISDLTLRANTALRPVAAGNVTEAEEMAALGRTRQSLLESPWGVRVKDEVLGTGGFLLEAVDSAIGERGSGLEMQAAVSPSKVVYGHLVTLSGTVRSGAGRNLGSYPLLVESAGMEAISLTTSPDGAFSINLPSQTLGLNTLQLTVTPDLDSWGIPSERFAVTDTTKELFVAPIPVTFRVVNNTEADLRQFSGVVTEWFSDLRLPIAINPPGASEMDIEYSWRVQDFPSTGATGGLRFSNVSADITISRGVEVVAVHSLEFVKDGGLNYAQAQQRAADTLVANLVYDDSLSMELKEIIDR